MKSKIDPESDVAQTLGLDQSLGRGKGLKRWLMVALLVVAAVTTVVIWKRMGHSNSVPYKTQEVQRGNLTVIVTATGTLQPTNQVDVGSYKYNVDEVRLLIR